MIINVKNINHLDLYKKIRMLNIKTYTKIKMINKFKVAKLGDVTLVAKRELNNKIKKLTVDLHDIEAEILFIQSIIDAHNNYIMSINTINKAGKLVHNRI